MKLQLRFVCIKPLQLNLYSNECCWGGALCSIGLQNKHFKISSSDFSELRKLNMNFMNVTFFWPFQFASINIDIVILQVLNTNLDKKNFASKSRPNFSHHWSQSHITQVSKALVSQLIRQWLTRVARPCFQLWLIFGDEDDERSDC